MPRWTQDYLLQLEKRFEDLTGGLDSRVEEFRSATSVPPLDGFPLGSARQVKAAVLFFDICGFTARTSNDEPGTLADTLYMLDSVIPTVMGIVFDYGGYVEKNTGDGVMAIVGVGDDEQKATRDALSIATVTLYAMREYVNPHLTHNGLEPVHVSFGIDYGRLLLARIGVPKGRAQHDRSHITAVGPTANIAFRLQDHAGDDEIVVGDLVRAFSGRPQERFVRRTPPDWSWVTTPSNEAYRAWAYTGRRVDPD